MIFGLFGKKNKTRHLPTVARLNHTIDMSRFKIDDLDMRDCNLAKLERFGRAEKCEEYHPDCYQVHYGKSGFRVDVGEHFDSATFYFQPTDSIHAKFAASTLTVVLCDQRIAIDHTTTPNDLIGFFGEPLDGYSDESKRFELIWGFAYWRLNFWFCREEGVLEGRFDINAFGNGLHDGTESDEEIMALKHLWD